VPGRVEHLTFNIFYHYSKELVEPQRGLLTYILRQLSSKELINNVMGVQKPRKDPSTGLSPATRYPLLEEQLISLFIEAMNEVEDACKLGEPDSNVSLLWWNLSSELIFFLLYQFVTFPTFVEGVYQAVKDRRTSEMRHGRDFLMWALLQFISGSIGMCINVLKALTQQFVLQSRNLSQRSNVSISHSVEVQGVP
jgi:hypothetical protein